MTFFEKRDHLVKEGVPLPVHNDPSLLFTNAGMVPFKNYFTGSEIPPHVNLTSVQKCLRISGKHNDLSEIGHTTNHHTFFEMCGNFSFGGYSKKEAIYYAWEFLTNELKLPKNRFVVSVHEHDLETFLIWKDILDQSSIIKLGDNSNTWSMADVGPFGTCTEIFYKIDETNNNQLTKKSLENRTRFIEVWNIVFMEFFIEQSGEIRLLNKLCVDTGMGLERLCAILNNTTDNYQSPIFSGLIKYVRSRLYLTEENNRLTRLIVDHIRAVSFLITDKVYPSNTKQGYVVRKLIRRMIKSLPYTQETVLAILDSFTMFIEMNKENYPELNQQKDMIIFLVRSELDSLLKIIQKSNKLLDKVLVKLENRSNPELALFKVYDTLGIPIDYATSLLKNKGFDIDKCKFDSLLEKHRTDSIPKSRKRK